jgi:alkyldihydroxyacetonephosphate synthase
VSASASGGRCGRRAGGAAARAGRPAPGGRSGSGRAVRLRAGGAAPGGRSGSGRAGTWITGYGQMAAMALARPRDAYPDPSWSGWGDPSRKPALTDSVRELLVQGLGVREPGRLPGSLTDLRLPPSRLDDATVAALAAVVGDDRALTEDEARLRHTRGKSLTDLLRLRAGDAAGAPDLVLMPGSHEQVLECLRICSQRRVAVVPFGGGTSVVGGLEPAREQFAGVVALDLRRMNALLALDEESRLAVLEPGLRAPQAEALLNERGYTIGHFPQSFEYLTVGGAAATRSSGQASAGYGRFDELVVALRVAIPAGTIELGRAPKSAAGPDLRELILGSEGALGVITSLTVQVRPLPESRIYDGWMFDSFAGGAATVRRLAQDGPLPTVLRLSDEAETALDLARPSELGGGAGGCLAIVGYEGSAEDVSDRRAGAGKVLAAAGAHEREGAGAAWARDRYAGPYLRDALLDAGVLVETLETVSFWSALPRLYESVLTALRDSLVAQGTTPIVLCHISHVYPSGASLYFTIACAQLDDPVAQWRAAKVAASDAIAAADGSITHHHGIGTDHVRWYEDEIGKLALGALAAVKRELDPAGILNPGVLIPRR